MYALLFRIQDYGGLNYFEYFSEPVIQKIIRCNFKHQVGFAIGSLLKTYLYSNTEIDHTEKGDEFLITPRTGASLFLYHFMETLHSQPNSLKTSFSCNEIAFNDILVITLTNINEDEIVHIETSMKKFPQYYGYVLVDSGFSVHYNLFYYYLFKIFIIYNNKIIVNQTYSDNISFLEKIIPKCTQIIFSAEEFLDLIEDSLDFVYSLKSHNEIRYQYISKQRSSIYERLINKIIDSVSKSNIIPIHFEVIPSFYIEQIVIAPKKIYGYCLDKNHPVGKDKAIVFETSLEISNKDWQFLAAQLRHGLYHGEPQKIKADKYGIKFNIIVPIIGNNGMTKDVVSGWIFDDKNQIRLTTVYIEKENRQSMRDASFFTYYVQEEDLFRFDKIYNIGIEIASKSAETFVPEPLFLEGYEPNEDGSCGYAFVLVDGRTKFGKWLKQKKIINMFGKITIGWKSDSQSYEKRLAFAETFNSILFYNGINGKIIKYID